MRLDDGNSASCFPIYTNLSANSIYIGVIIYWLDIFSLYQTFCYSKSKNKCWRTPI